MVLLPITISGKSIMGMIIVLYLPKENLSS
ncbi:MAG: hypothetical protein RIS29_3292 [Bacteroidota bacterium]|jgi:hypothetical protein